MSQLLIKKHNTNKFAMKKISATSLRLLKMDNIMEYLLILQPPSVGSKLMIASFKGQIKDVRD